MDEYRKVKSDIECTIRRNKKLYYDNLYNGATSKPKVLWNKLKRLSGKSTNVHVLNYPHTACNFNQLFF